MTTIFIMTFLLAPGERGSPPFQAARPSSATLCDKAARNRVTPGRDLRSVLAVIIDFEQAHLVASAFDDAPRVQDGTTVRAAYADLDAQAARWFDRLTGAHARKPVRVVYTRTPEPYATARELSDSVRRHRLLEIFPASRDRDRRHPLLDTSVGGAYDRFRAVHDIVSHGWWRNGFDRQGEFSAWLAEDRMYGGLARWALATELHGEHSTRWTTGDLADHKAVLLDPGLLEASRMRGGVAAQRGNPRSSRAGRPA